MVPGSFPPARACFSWPRRCFGLPQLPLPAIKNRSSLSSSLRLIRSPRHALGFAQRRTSKLAGVAAKRELEIIAKPLGLLHEALLSGRSFLRTETRSYSLPLQRIACRLPICLVRCSPIFAIVTYFVGRAARALRSFVELRWCGS